MPVDLFMVLPPTNLPSGAVTADPTLDAYFKTSAFANQLVVEIRSFSLDVENITLIGSLSGGAGAGKAVLNPALIERSVDTLSPSLFRVCASGAHFSKMQVFVRKSGTATGKPYLVYSFGLVFVNKIDWSVSEGDELPVERMEFVYGQLVLSYYPQKPDGTFGVLKPAMWNQMTNTDTVPPDVSVGA